MLYRKKLALNFVLRFPTAISICKDIYDCVPPDVVAYKLYAKVMTGLKMLVCWFMVVYTVYVWVLHTLFFAMFKL